MGMLALGCGGDIEPEPLDPLVYKRTIHLAGLGEDVTIVKSPERVYAVRADGSQQDYLDVMLHERRAYRSRFGALSAEFHGRVSAAAPDEAIDVAVMFDVPGLAAAWRPYSERADDERARAVVLGQVERAIAVEAEPLSASLRELGFVETARGTLMPALYGRAPASAVLAIAHVPNVRRIASNEREPAVELATTDSIIHHAIDTVYNSAGLYGADQKLGLVEANQFDPTAVNTPGSNSLFHEHQAFGHAPAPQYQTTSFGSCQGGNKSCGSSSYCLTQHGNRCSNAHSNWVASVAVHSKGGTNAHGAGAAQIYYPNGQSPLSSAGADATYTWLAENGVHVTTETFPGGGLVQDYYAQYADILVVRAAGNNPGVEACGGGPMNGLCVGGTDVNRQMWADSPNSGSSWCNPGSSCEANLVDREEPDLVTFSGASSGGATNFPEVLHEYQTTSWKEPPSAGTSFAAPAVAAMALLLREKCLLTGGYHQALRAWLRNGAYVANPHGEPYSTPSDQTSMSYDFRDGAGWLSAEGLDWYCDPSSGSGTHGVTTISTGDPMPPGEPIYEPGLPHPQARPMSYDAPPGNRLAWRIGIGTFGPGNRIRASISWDACVSEPTGTRTVGTDFDLFLYNATLQRYVYGSQSIADVEEGFDVTLWEEAGDGEYEVIIAWPEGSSGCNGPVLDETVGWSIRWW